MIQPIDFRALAAGQIARAELARILDAEVPDPAAVALIRLPMHAGLGFRFARHLAEWPVARIAREWDRYRDEAHRLLAELDTLPGADPLHGG